MLGASDLILSPFFSFNISFIPNLNYALFDISFSCEITSPIPKMLPAIVHQIGNQQWHGAQMWYMNPSVSESNTVLLQLGLKMIQFLSCSRPFQLFLDVAGLVDLGPTWLCLHNQLVVLYITSSQPLHSVIVLSISSLIFYRNYLHDIIDM